MSFITGGVLFPSNAGDCHNPHRTSAKSRRCLVTRKTRRIWRLVEVEVDSSNVSPTMQITWCSQFSVLGVVVTYSFTTKFMHTCHWMLSSKHFYLEFWRHKFLFLSSIASLGPSKQMLSIWKEIMTASVHILPNSSFAIIQPLDIKWPMQLQKQC